MTNKQEFEQAIRGAEEIKKGLLANIEFMSNIIDVMKKLAAEKVEPKKKEWRQKPTEGEAYYFIWDDGLIDCIPWKDNRVDNNRYNAGNCFPCALFTEEQVQQIALTNQLNSLLTQYAIVNGALASEEEREVRSEFLWWVRNQDSLDLACCGYPPTAIFNNRKVAEQARKDVIEPFCEAHPEFVW